MPLIRCVSLRSKVRSLCVMIATNFYFACRCKWKAVASLYDEILLVRWYNFNLVASRGVTVPTVNQSLVFDKEPPPTPTPPTLVLQCSFLSAGVLSFDIDYGWYFSDLYGNHELFIVYLNYISGGLSLFMWCQPLNSYFTKLSNDNEWNESL